MRVTLFNGQRSPTRGWFSDQHGHRLFLRLDDFAPICPRFGPGAVLWRLVNEVPDNRR